ncbi:ABC transporter permease [Parafilimonas sp.]|uniref:ABC transporter permease n=1 Tax=Parafilimonas sp. TaxID=1969739 RepID=UPI0039E34F12
MHTKYSQFKAMLAISKASLSSIVRSPSAVIFSIAFPLIFILVFGFIGGENGISLNVALNKNADTSNLIYHAIKNISSIHIVQEDSILLKEDLEKGNITAIINIAKNVSGNPEYVIELKSSEAVNPQNIQVLQSILKNIISNINAAKYPQVQTIAAVSNTIEKIPGRAYRRIDFILPGQLGFSLLSAGVFGVAFSFFNLRQQLILKRFFATPIRRTFIVLGEALSRVVFQMMTAIIIIGLGVFAFKFTLVKGLITFLEIMLLSFIALIVFMGFGFIVSSVAKNESTIPPFANIFTLPQFLLAGTFFPITVFPRWLQVFCNILPLTHFNNAMRNISFEGASFISCWPDVGVLLLWGIFIYAAAVKVFRWE